MTSRANELLRQALMLPPDERAGVASELLASLEDTDVDVDAIQKEWAAEIERRAARVLAGESAGIAWEDARRRADAELRDR